MSCHASTLPVSAAKPPDRVMNPELDDSDLTDLTQTQYQYHSDASREFYSEPPPRSSMCGKLLEATYISLKQKPSGLNHLTLPKIHCCFAFLDRFFSAFCTGYWKIKPCLTFCDTGSSCQDVFLVPVRVFFLMLLVCERF